MSLSKKTKQKEFDEQLKWDLSELLANWRKHLHKT